MEIIGPPLRRKRNIMPKKIRLLSAGRPSSINNGLCAKILFVLALTLNRLSKIRTKPQIRQIDVIVPIIAARDLPSQIFFGLSGYVMASKRAIAISVTVQFLRRMPAWINRTDIGYMMV